MFWSGNKLFGYHWFFPIKVQQIAPYPCLNNIAVKIVALVIGGTSVRVTGSRAPIGMSGNYFSLRLIVKTKLDFPTKCIFANF